jgi:hypothetical protein
MLQKWREKSSNCGFKIDIFIMVAKVYFTRRLTEIQFILGGALQEGEYDMKSTHAITIPDLDFDIMPGGSTEPVLHLPAVGIIIAIIHLTWSEPAQ